MSRMLIITYPDAKFATFLSVIGSILALSGLYALFTFWLAGLILMLIGAGLMYLASLKAKATKFKKWIKALKAKGILDELPYSQEICITLYQANPCKKTLKFISRHNPQAATYIAQFIVTQPSKA